MSILISVIVAIFSAVSPSAMPNNYYAVNMVYASPINSLASSVLSVDVVPETQRSTIAWTEKKGKDEVGDDFDTENTPEGIVGLIRENFRADWEIMLGVARCESELKPKAQNRHSTAKGIFQILDGTWKHFKCEGDPLNAEDNIVCGKKVLDGQGLGAWSESFSCWKNL